MPEGGSAAHQLAGLDELVAGTEIAVRAGNLDGSGLRLALCCSRFNVTVTRRLLEGARARAIALGVDEADLEIVSVPGALELPLAALSLAWRGSLDAIVCLGSVIRGETSHYDLVAGESAAGCMRVQLDTGLPIAFGVLTTEDLDQALARSGGAGGDKGAEAVDTAIEMARLVEGIGGEDRGSGNRAVSRAR